MSHGPCGRGGADSAGVVIVSATTVSASAPASVFKLRFIFALIASDALFQKSQSAVLMNATGKLIHERHLPRQLHRCFWSRARTHLRIEIALIIELPENSHHI